MQYAIASSGRCSTRAPQAGQCVRQVKLLLAHPSARFGDDADDLRNHIARALNDDRIADANVFAANLVLVVERRAGDEHACDIDRLQLRDGVETAGAPDLNRDRIDARRTCVAGNLYAVAQRGSRATIAEFLLQAEAVHLDHDAIYLEVECVPLLVPVLAALPNRVNRVARHCMGRRAEPECVKACQ